MKKILFIACLTTLFSCKEESQETPNHSRLAGDWQLTERLADPGDGSGTFQPTSQYLILHIDTDDTYSLEGSLCSFGDFNTKSTGTFRAEELKIYPDDCPETSIVPDYGLPYTLEGNQLTIYLLCIEGCGYRFEKLSS
ncbi:hypothetical protein BFP72_16490 [Reichenbachiella sp. 5M10]|uniref:hypothetical protein n=1 Tax=Reichenbachiella sp. 5M10 TaxID=1889772 RepID=UPI000C15F4E3|nr:hypothetical protein [Reichenbachiella sp. 5M10]PIB36886.1 hypothetical protein BFP72_16490 [Reichenbachiella sp. 5M10]